MSLVETFSELRLLVSLVETRSEFKTLSEFS